MKELYLKEIMDESQNLKYFFVISSLYVASILVSITVSARLLPFHIPVMDRSIFLTGGTWTIPLTFFFQDIATEVYGYSKSRQIVLLAIPIVIVFVLYLKLTTYFPLPERVSVSGSYNIVLNELPRHLIAFLAAITAGNLINSFLLSKLKKLFKGKYLPLRFIGSTAVGEAILQVVGTSIAWLHNLNFYTEILPFIFFSYGYKVFFEAIMTPVSVCICNWLKKKEGIDVYEA